MQIRGNFFYLYSYCLYVFSWISRLMTTQKPKKSISFGFAVTFFLYFKTMGKEFLPETWSWKRALKGHPVYSSMYPSSLTAAQDKGHWISRALHVSFIHLATNHLCGNIFSAATLYCYLIFICSCFIFLTKLSILPQTSNMTNKSSRWLKNQLWFAITEIMLSEKHSGEWERRNLSERLLGHCIKSLLKKHPLLTQSRKFCGVPILKKGFHEQILGALID